MADYRRNYVAGGTFFFTLVVHERHPLFSSALARRLLRESIQRVHRNYPFELFAICLLPDHLHTVWILPPDDRNYPTRLRRIKEEFTAGWVEQGDWEGNVSPSRSKKGERGIWQRRYWEHTVRDEDDLERCVDYVHWNPRKHGLVRRVQDWPWSTFHRFVRLGQYGIHWGGTDPCLDGKQPDQWGE
jgi:putative transposase